MNDINAKSTGGLNQQPKTEGGSPGTPTPHKFCAAYSPKTYPDADVVLVSKDGIRFSVHGAVLTLSSSFFRDKLLQHRNDSTSPTTIPLGENSDVVSVLLDILYPDKPLPDIPRITLFYYVAVALDKYNMKGALQKLSKYVTPLKNQYPASYLPIPLYSIARKFQWTEVQQAASESSLSTSIISAASLKSLGESVQVIDTHSLIVFQDWHERRKKIVLDATEDLRPKATTFSFGITSTGTCHGHFSWNNLHITSTTVLAPGQTICTVDSDLNGQRQTWNNALEQFQIRLRNAVDQRADCGLVLNDKFWNKNPWEFSTFKCSACQSDILDKSRLRVALKSLISQLPKHPDDKSEPVQMPRASFTNSGGTFGDGPSPMTTATLFKFMTQAGLSAATTTTTTPPEVTP